MLVEGACVRVKTKNGYEKLFAFGETFIIPAKAVSYELINDTGVVCKLVKAFIKS